MTPGAVVLFLLGVTGGAVCGVAFLRATRTFRLRRRLRRSVKKLRRLCATWVYLYHDGIETGEGGPLCPRCLDWPCRCGFCLERYAEGGLNFKILRILRRRSGL